MTEEDITPTETDGSEARPELDNNPLNDERLITFAVLAHEKNYRRAAERLNITQPALHARIKKLQAELKFELFIVGTHRIDGLTAQGNALLDFARQSRKLAGDSLAAITNAGSTTMTIAAGRGACLYVISDAVKALADRETGIRVVHANNATSVNAVRNGEVDLGVIAQIPVEHGLESQELRTYRQMLVVNQSDELANHELVKVKDLHGMTLALPDRSEPHRADFERLFAENRIKVTVESEALHWDILIKFVEFGIQGTIVNEFVPLPDGLIGIPIADARTITYSLIWRKARASKAEEFTTAFAGVGRVTGP